MPIYVSQHSPLIASILIYIKIHIDIIAIGYMYSSIISMVVSFWIPLAIEQGKTLKPMCQNMDE